MRPILCTERLQPSELQALFGEEKDYSCSLNDIVHHAEESERSDSENIPACDLSSLSDIDMPCAAHHLQRPVFSNQEYYSKLEELKREHLRNMADLEKLYLSQTRPAQKERQLIASWRLNEDDPESEQVELIQIDSKVSVGRLKNGDSHSKLKRVRQNSFEDHRKLCQSQQNTFHTAANQVIDNLRRNSKVTIPKPFRMMLREEDRKRRNVKTRSEIELENERLKKELDELKECGKRFRAKPAPASTHLLLYDIINNRPNKVQRPKNYINLKDHGHQQQQATQRHASPLPQQPFSFIERERKKREKKLAEELDNLTPKTERRMFKARPVPKFIYRPSSPNSLIYRTEIRSALPPSILEDTLQEAEEVEKEFEDEFEELQCTDTSRCGSNLKKWKNKNALQMEEEMERKKNREKERDWSYIHPLPRTSCHNHEPLIQCKSDYISV